MNDTFNERPLGLYILKTIHSPRLHSPLAFLLLPLPATQPATSRAFSATPRQDTPMNMPREPPCTSETK